MGILDFFRKKEVKSSSAASYPASSFVGFLQASGHWDLSFLTLTQYYEKCDPFSNAVNIIMEALADIQPLVWDKQKEEFVDHEILNLLEYPSNSMSGKDFLTQFAGTYLITGNPFIKSIGPVRRPPLELDIVNPSQVSDIQPDRVGDMPVPGK